MWRPLPQLSEILLEGLKRNKKYNQKRTEEEVLFCLHLIRLTTACVDELWLFTIKKCAKETQSVSIHCFGNGKINDKRRMCRLQQNIKKHPSCGEMVPWAHGGHKTSFTVHKSRSFFLLQHVSWDAPNHFEPNFKWTKIHTAVWCKNYRI